MTAGEIFPVSGEIVLNKDQAVSRMEAATSTPTEAASMPSLAQRLFSEWIGTAFLLAAVVGSGIMAAKLAGGNGAVALLCNTLPTGAIWVVLILIFGPVSGAYLNPAVSVAFALRPALPWRDAALYIPTQIVGGIVGVWAVHGMFGLPLWQFSAMARTGTGQWLAETVGTFGVILTIFGCVARAPSALPFAVGLYVTSASWFTASGSFANPAVTIARSLSDTFAGIAPAGVLVFIISQVAGMVLGVAVALWLWPKSANMKMCTAAWGYGRQLVTQSRNIATAQQ
jgi:glycerol uptake facilitator-like aquaporin